MRAYSDMTGMNNLPSFSIIIPTKNERNNLVKLLPVLTGLYPRSPIWIVDDNSADLTEEFVINFSQKHPQVHLLLRQNKRGRGSAVIDGLKEATKDKKISYFLEMDADFSHNPNEIKKLLQETENAKDTPGVVLRLRHTPGVEEPSVGDVSQYNKQPKIPILKTELNAPSDRSFLGGDTAWQGQSRSACLPAGRSEKFGIEAARIIIGSRHIPGAKFVNCSLLRVILSKIANLYIKLILQVPIADYTNGFRLYPRKAVEILLNAQIREKGYVTLSETAYILHQKGFKFKEVPTIFVNRTEGRSHATIFEFLRSIPAIIKIRKN